MHITVTQREVKTALCRLMHVPENGNAPSITLGAFREVCTLSLHDAHTEVSAVFLAQVQEEGVVSIALAAFWQLLLSLHNEEMLTLSTTDTHCLIQTPTTCASFLLRSEIQEHSSLAALTPLELFTLPGHLFAESIADIAFAAATGENVERAYFSCVLIQPAYKDGIELTGCDTVMMARRILYYTHTLSRQLLLPAVSLSRIASLFIDEEVVHCFSNAHTSVVTFTGKSIECSLRTLDGAYPIFRGIYGSQYSVSCTLATDAFLNAVKRARIHGSKCIHVSIHDYDVSLASQEDHAGDVETTLTGKIHGKATFSVYTDYLLAILTHLKTDLCTLECDAYSSRRAITLLPADERVRYVLTPLAA